jgi:hypothetical protein
MFVVAVSFFGLQNSSSTLSTAFCLSASRIRIVVAAFIRHCLPKCFMSCHNRGWLG